MVSQWEDRRQPADQWEESGKPCSLTITEEITGTDQWPEELQHVDQWQETLHQPNTKKMAMWEGYKQHLI